VPFQRNQMQKIVEIMGMPNKERWPLITSMPDYSQLSTVRPPDHHHHHHHSHHSSRSYPATSQLEKWYYNTINHAGTSSSSSSSNNNTQSPLASLGPEGYKLLAGLLEYDPSKRLTAEQALQHPFFTTGDKVFANAFEGLKVEYPHRRVSQDDNDIRTSSLPGTKRSAITDDLLRPSKRMKD
jgi:cyclin-dependent kinase 8/11